MSVLDRFRLDGKVAVITGASSGLGAAFAIGLADAGADIAICARRTDRLQQTKADVEALGRRCIAVTADVAIPEDCHRVARRPRTRSAGSTSSSTTPGSAPPTRRPRRRRSSSGR